MFFCEACRARYQWPESIGRSIGCCEVCSERAACYEVPSSRLPFLPLTTGACSSVALSPKDGKTS